MLSFTISMCSCLALLASNKKQIYANIPQTMDFCLSIQTFIICNSWLPGPLPRGCLQCVFNYYQVTFSYSGFMLFLFILLNSQYICKYDFRFFSNLGCQIFMFQVDPEFSFLFLHVICLFNMTSLQFNYFVVCSWISYLLKGAACFQ